MEKNVIANPVINSPYQKPERHFHFGEEGITNTIVSKRRVSAYFVPIAKPKKKKAKQLGFGEVHEEWTSDRLQENKFINQVRERVDLWRRGGYTDVSRTTRRLLDHWQRPERERRLFFCQLEALETIIYVTEVAHKYGDGWIADQLRRGNESANPALYRIAFKMATGSGKTVVMGMMTRLSKS